MRKLRWICLAALGALVLHAAPALAGPPSAASSAPMPGPWGDFDWVQHTRHTLDELKGKLNLSQGQAAAWDAWSGGVLKDAHQQLEQRKHRKEDRRPAAENSLDETTPESMARGIARLRAQTAWMQEHLLELEAAQLRTQTFYELLDTNQKTIFDLFWHEMHHRTAGHDEDWAMREDGSAGRGCQQEEDGCPAYRP
jgi:hypothetical protein